MLLWPLAGRAGGLSLTGHRNHETTSEVFARPYVWPSTS
jgi:hypothetical protein